MVYKSG